DPGPAAARTAAGRVRQLMGSRSIRPEGRGWICTPAAAGVRTLGGTMSKQQRTNGKGSGRSSGKGGSPKKAIKRLRRKAVATLRQARLTAQLELVAADAVAAQIRERALADAAEETAAVRTSAREEAARILEQARTDAAALAGERRDTANAEA